jgi:hypothetical protein
MYYIERKHDRVHAKAIPGNHLEAHIFDTFSYAVSAYSYVLPFDEKVSGKEWVEKIKTCVSTSPRTLRVIEAIEIAMDESKSYVI